MVNRVILIGNLGQDPEVRRLENGAAVAKLRLATNENYKDKSGQWQTSTEWHDVVAWRTLAERAESQLTKGAQIYVEGKLTHRVWEDQDGNKRKTTEVVANYFRMIGGRREDSSGSGGGYFPSPEDEERTAGTMRPPSSGSSEPAKQAAADPAADDGSSDDDLPF